MVKGGDVSCYRLKLSKADVEAVRAVARIESLRLDRDVCWCDLVRAAMRWMRENKRPVVQ